MTKQNLNSLAFITAAIVVVTLVGVSALHAQSGQAKGQAPVQATTDVNVINKPTVKNSDAPGRKPLQTGMISFTAPGYKNWLQSLGIVPANQRLIIEYVSGACNGVNASRFYLRSGPMGQAPKGWLILPYTNNFVSTAVRFIVDPGDEVVIWVDNQNVTPESCTMTVTGYYVTLP